MAYNSAAGLSGMLKEESSHSIKTMLRFLLASCFATLTLV